MDAIKVFGVAAMAPKQKAAFEAHCTGDCGKISIGGVIADEVTGGLFVCCEPTCPHMAAELPDYGTTMSFGRKHEITLRLLKPVAASTSVDAGEVPATAFDTATAVRRSHQRGMP